MKVLTIILSVFLITNFMYDIVKYNLERVDENDK